MVKTTRKGRRWLAGVASCVLAAGLLAGCGSNGADRERPASDAEGTKEPLKVSIGLTQVGDIPAKGNEVERAIEAYTGVKLDIQWIPQSTYDEKISVMIASSELPKIVKLNYTPLIISSIQSDMFWELGPYLQDYPNLAAQGEQHYKNISVEGKVYGVPLFRDIGRAAFNYRKDWLEKLGLSVPVTLDDWYATQKAMVQQDPDGNGQNDTYGFVLEKQYNLGNSALPTRLAVSIGGVNRWGMVDGKITPEMMTKEYREVLAMLRRMFEEGLINRDFAVLDSSESSKFFDSGRAGLGNAVAQSVKSQHDRLIANDPNAVVDNAAFAGPDGIRLAGEPGHNGFLAIPRSSVASEEELKQLLGFLDKLMDEPLATLLMRGVEGKHFAYTEDDRTEFLDFSLFQREVKPYRDNLPNVEGYHVKTLKDTELGEKGTRMAKENAQYAIPNAALTLSSVTYSERGAELDQLLQDAQTKYIMGKIDDAGLDQDIQKWLQAGGQKIIDEYQAAYDALNAQ